MADHEAIQSHASHESEDFQKQVQQEREISHLSPPSGRITVTVASVSPHTLSPSLPPPSTTATPSYTPPASLTLALPIQQYSAQSAAVAPAAYGGGSIGREDYWSDEATSVLINAWGERYMELNRGNLKQNDWKEVADVVRATTKTPKTDIQCKNRIDTVKKKYKIEKTKVVAGCGPSRWPFYERLDRLILPSAALTSNPGAAVSASPVGINAQKAVPVGIPFGVRQPMPMLFPPYTSPPPQPPPQNYPNLISPQQRFNHNHISNVSNYTGRQPLQQHVRHNFPTQNLQQHIGYVSNNNGRRQQQQPPPQYHHLQPELKRKPLVGSLLLVDLESEEEGSSHDSEDSLPPERGYERRTRRRSEMNVSGGVKKRKGKKAVKVWGKSVRELTRAVLKFGEAYEMAESTKLEHIVEMEKQRMKFAKELELQRMKFFMKTQLKLSQFNGGSGNSGSRGGESGGRTSGRGGGGGGESSHVHHENHVNQHANSDWSN